MWCLYFNRVSLAIHVGNHLKICFYLHFASNKLKWLTLEWLDITRLGRASATSHMNVMSTSLDINFNAGDTDDIDAETKQY